MDRKQQLTHLNVNGVFAEVDLIVIITVHLFELFFSERIDLHSCVELTAVRPHTYALQVVQVSFSGPLDTNQHAGWDKHGLELYF